MVLLGVCFVVAAFFGTCATNHLSADSVEKARVERGCKEAHPSDPK